MNVLQYLLSVHRYGAGGFWSKNNPKTVASGSEIRIWIQSSALSINGYISNDPSEEIDYPLHSVILFPSNPQKRITLL